MRIRNLAPMRGLQKVERKVRGDERSPVLKVSIKSKTSLWGSVTDPLIDPVHHHHNNCTIQSFRKT